MAPIFGKTCDFTGAALLLSEELFSVEELVPGKNHAFTFPNRRLDEQVTGTLALMLEILEQAVIVRSRAGLPAGRAFRSYQGHY